MHIDISDVARVMAALSPDERASLDARVDKLKRDEAFLKEQAIAELRAMSDNEVIVRALNAGKSAARVLYDNPTMIEIDEVLRVLREAGFSREEPKQNIEFIYPGGKHIEIYGSKEALESVRDDLCGAFPGMKYSKGA
ncbi:hypothetical protein [Methylobacterium pseudosasicola]|uniref:Uncharacterized protein n=1 Tax=Methylobacterium pseudosasicola TaxID=582667 RepID=A0A1I4PTL0_9HYPH|nr:hypothetical protein [Methylobacterium pseudosasicola]SFM30906.1 hypothetical protein SAMN05192568_102645 [Methylobacterium pseudosasicola]